MELLIVCTIFSNNVITVAIMTANGITDDVTIKITFCETEILIKTLV